MEIRRGERVYTSYIFKLKDGSVIKLLAKELVNGRLDLVIIGQYENEKRVLMKVKEVDKEGYEEKVVSYIAEFLSKENALEKVEVLYPQVFEAVLKKKDG